MSVVRKHRATLKLLMVAVLCLAAVAVAIRGPGRIARRAKALVADLRRDLRERRHAAFLATEPPVPQVADTRLPVAELVLDSRSGLAPGWQDHGWSPHELSPGRPASIDLSGYGGLILARPGMGRAYGGLELRFRAPQGHGEFLEVQLGAPGGVKLAPVRGMAGRGTVGADGFTEVWIPMSELNPAGRPVEQVRLHAWQKVGAERVLLDRVAFTEEARPPRQPPRSAGFQVDCRAPGHPINPLVYGIATYYADAGPQQWTLGATARRWGGNHASRYNPDLHAWNLDRDWFFRNGPTVSVETFLEENRAHGLASTVTVPMLGWVAKDTSSFSFPVSRLGPQQAVAFDTPDAGNGLRPDGRPIPSPPPTATSVACPPECVERWLRRLREARLRSGEPAPTYILDNEPMIWSSTHRDVHPEPPGYDELLERTIAYASAIRRADPEALIAGPAECGWPTFHFSAKDLAASVWLRPDRLRHGNVPLLPWYLRQLRAHEARTGQSLLDVVDVHFYPMADVGVASEGSTDPATSALRIRTTRSLWDPGYVDESWVDEPMQLLRLLRRWIDESYPGRKISIGEWNFGADTHMSGGLAAAEALGRFGTEGIHSAYYWTYPPDRSPAYWAFRAFRNFDGAGGRFLDRSVPVTGRAPLASVFASADAAAGRVVAVLLNHDPNTPLQARLDLLGCGGWTEARAYTYAGGPGGFERGPDPRPGEGRLELQLEPYSMTVLELRPPGPAR